MLTLKEDECSDRTWDKGESENGVKAKTFLKQAGSCEFSKQMMHVTNRPPDSKI
jgi:hypothetical protein